MTSTMGRFGLGIGAAAMAVALTVSAAGVYAGAQNSSQDPGSGRGRPGGPGGRGGPGGPGGRFGGPGGPGGRGGPMRVLGPIPLEGLGLSDAQREQVRAVMQPHDDELRALNDRAFAARQALELTVMADVVDEGAIRAKSAEVAAVDADLAVTRARIRSEVFELLTPEQRAKAREMPPRPDNRRPPPAQ